MAVEGAQALGVGQLLSPKTREKRGRTLERTVTPGRELKRKEREARSAEARREAERAAAPNRAKAAEFLRRRERRGFKQSILSQTASQGLKTTFGE